MTTENERTYWVQMKGKLHRELGLVSMDHLLHMMLSPHKVVPMHEVRLVRSTPVDRFWYALALPQMKQVAQWPGWAQVYYPLGVAAFGLAVLRWIWSLL